MRHGSPSRRPRSRGNNGSNGSNGGRNKPQNRNRVFDSSGPEVRIRGTAYQITEKYMVLAKDATSSGDHVLAQSYMQHAEHYQRIVNEWAEQDRPLQASIEENEDSEDTSESPSVRIPQKISQENCVLEDA